MFLSLAHNALDGPIPESLTMLTKLQQLDLAGNSLNGTIPAQLAALSDLKALDLSGNTTARAPARTRVRARERRGS